MKLLDILQGRWLGHPLHPAIVHVPIGGWIAACVLDVAAALGWTTGGPRDLALACVALGLIGAAIAVPPGIADWMGIKPDKPAWKLALYHMVLNVVAVVVWIVNLMQRLRTSVAVTHGILMTSVLGTALVVISGYLGSLLVFEHGVSIARQSKQTWRKIAERGGARLPEES